MPINPNDNGRNGCTGKGHAIPYPFLQSMRLPGMTLAIFEVECTWERGLNMFGYMGKILCVNLTKEEIGVRALEGELARQSIGGSGLAAYFLNADTDEDTDPLGPENPLIMMNGPFTRTGVPTSGRLAVVAKSPLTGVGGESDVGGSWGLALKRAGYDGLIVKGRSIKPVYLYINDQDVEIRDASGLWGKDTYAVDSQLKNELGQAVSCCSIGPAGENLVRFACIITDGTDGRAAGRCGLGAVMGSKKLKAIAVGGRLLPDLYDCDSLQPSIAEITPQIAEDLASSCKGNELCNCYGLDTISTGRAVAFAIECFQNGLLTLDDTDGLTLDWNNPRTIMELIKRIAYRKGVGNLLADGVRAASERLGGIGKELTLG